VNESALAAGLAALGFWLFVTAVVVAGVWAMVRRREMQNQLVQRLLESGQAIDQAMLDRILPPRSSARTAGFVLVVLGICIAAMGFAADTSYPIVALGALAFLCGAYVWRKADR
jgi:hypothetical protein